MIFRPRKPPPPLPPPLPLPPEPPPPVGVELSGFVVPAGPILLSPSLESTALLGAGRAVRGTGWEEVIIDFGFSAWPAVDELRCMRFPETRTRNPRKGGVLIVSGTDGRGFTRFAMICLAGEIEPKTRTYEELRGPETRGSPGTRFSKSAAATKVILWNPDDPQVHSIESTGGSPSTRSPDAGFRGGTVGATCLRGRAEPGVGFV